MLFRLGARVEDVKASDRLVDSPALAVNADKFMSPQMRRMMKAMKKDGADEPVKVTLEINPRSVVMKRLFETHATAPEKAKLVAEQILDIRLLLHQLVVLALELHFLQLAQPPQRREREAVHHVGPLDRQRDDVAVALRDLPAGSVRVVNVAPVDVGIVIGGEKLVLSAGKTYQRQVLERRPRTMNREGNASHATDGSGMAV